MLTTCDTACLLTALDAIDAVLGLTMLCFLAFLTWFGVQPEKASDDEPADELTS